MGDNARDGTQWLPSALPFWKLHSCKNCKCLEPWLERQTNTKLSPQDTIRKVLKRRWLRCPRIVHLDLICWGYDQKKRCESNWKFDSRPQFPWKHGSNEVQLGRVIHCWKDLFEHYKILPLHFQQKKLDLRKIWAFKVLKQQEFQFWHSHLGVLGKNDIWM
jgi:hypothetical protein